MADLYPNRSEFEAEADRARESARELVAASLAAEAARDWHAPLTGEGRSPRRLVDRIRSRLATILGR